MSFVNTWRRCIRTTTIPYLTWIWWIITTLIQVQTYCKWFWTNDILYMSLEVTSHMVLTYCGLYLFFYRIQLFQFILYSHQMQLFNFLVVHWHSMWWSVTHSWKRWRDKENFILPHCAIFSGVFNWRCSQNLCINVYCPSEVTRTPYSNTIATDWSMLKD